MTSRLHEIASGVDALYLSARTVLSPSFLAKLEDRRTWAQEVRRPTPCEMGEAIFGMAPHGWGKYRFCLDHPMARVGLTTSRFVPTVRIQPRAEYLHSYGPAGAVELLAQVLGPVLGSLSFWVNRVDLFSDWQGWPLDIEDGQRFVCRADARRTYEVGGTLTGFEFGSRKTKTVSARLYNKSIDVSIKGTNWWFEVWGDRYVPERPVHRMEFEISRGGLDQFNLQTPAQVLAAVGDLWSYATEQWLTYRSPTLDRTRSRWPIAPEWQQVQRASLRHELVGIERIYGARQATSLAKLLPGLTGYMASFAALVGTEGIDDTAGAVGHHLRDYEIISHTPFVDRVERRRIQQVIR
jgi:hypothetical protein